MLPIEVLEFLATPTKEASHTLNRAFGTHGNSPSYRVIELGIFQPCNRATDFCKADRSQLRAFLAFRALAAESP
jgi:hypothetical protein